MADQIENRLYTTPENKRYFDESTATLENGVVFDATKTAVDYGIKNPEYVGYPVTGLTVNEATVALSEVGQTSQLTLTFAPLDAANKNVIWTTSDATKATVSDTGLVTAVAAGTATITATTVDGGFTDTSAVTVTIA